MLSKELFFALDAEIFLCFYFVHILEGVRLLFRAFVFGECKGKARAEWVARLKLRPRKLDLGLR